MKSWSPLPREVYEVVESTPGTVLLENARAAAHAPLSRLFVSPVRTVEATSAEELRDLFAQIEDATARGQYAAGFFAYECGGVFEPKAAAGVGTADHPLAWFGIYERCYRFDHATGAFLDGEPPGMAGADTPQSNAEAARELTLEMTPALSEGEYAARIEQIHEWIRRGDVYQLNFTFPMRTRVEERASSLYAGLGRRQPVEYGAFVHWRRGRRILCFSPELFFRMEEEDGGARRRITTQPMKGTARRGRTTAEDRQAAEWLHNDAKNRSENVMIVDLIRNDLGRLCEFGSVRVEDLFLVERYPTLWQMTSTVTGELRRDVGYFDVFRALFPCGSITGAPKVRAMELLAQMEVEPRGAYTGAIGYFSGDRTVFNVAIRTLELEEESAKMGVGGGIVIDSTADAEFRECMLKAEFLNKQEEGFSLIETLLWRGGYPLLHLHLDRLADSADYFGFACDRGAVEAALLMHAAGFRDERARKVRLLMDREGNLQIEDEVIGNPVEMQMDEVGRVCVADERTDPEDRFLYHKTTHRQFYEREIKAAREAGCVDALFLNTRGEVTEGAVHNVFVEKEGRWFTPPVTCGLLPGVYRRHLMETRADVEERVLKLDDLRTADAIYLTNAVRGLRRVTLEEG